MGFRKDSWATVWGVEPKKNTVTQVRISISRKDRQTGDYVTDFSGFVGFVGTAAAAKALKLREKDRIKLGDVDVTTYYNPETKVTRYNFTCFNFETADEVNNNSSGDGNSASAPKKDESFMTIESDDEEGELPW